MVIIIMTSVNNNHQIMTSHYSHYYTEQVATPNGIEISIVSSYIRTVNKLLNIFPTEVIGLANCSFTIILMLLVGTRYNVAVRNYLCEINKKCLKSSEMPRNVVYIHF